jgi:hypothetical protein
MKAGGRWSLSAMVSSVADFASVINSRSCLIDHVAALGLRAIYGFVLPEGTGDFLASKPLSVNRKKTSFFGPCSCRSIQPFCSSFSKSRALGGSAPALIQPAPRKYCMNWRSG